MAGKVPCSPGVFHVTPAELEVRDETRDCRRTDSGGGSHDSDVPEVGLCHVTLAEPEVGQSHVTPAQPEVGWNT